MMPALPPQITEHFKPSNYQTQPIIVIGGSLGAQEALKTLLNTIPEDFAAPIFVVLHIGAHSSQLPWLLNNIFRKLPALHPEDGTPIQPGHIYIAPPDHHMIV